MATFFFAEKRKKSLEIIQTRDYFYLTSFLPNKKTLAIIIKLHANETSTFAHRHSE